jgi:hypothetical protein
VLAGVGITLPHWKDALNRFMREREAIRGLKFDVRSVKFPDQETSNLER